MSPATKIKSFKHYPSNNEVVLEQLSNKDYRITCAKFVAVTSVHSKAEQIFRTIKNMLKRKKSAYVSTFGNLEERKFIAYTTINGKPHTLLTSTDESLIKELCLRANDAFSKSSTPITLDYAQDPSQRLVF